MNPIQFGQRLAQVLPQRMAAPARAAGPVAEAAPADTCQIGSAPASATAWTEHLASFQEQFGAQGTSILVGIAQHVGRELVSPQTEANWAKRTAFANSTYDSKMNPRLDKICGKLREVSTLGELKLNPILEEKETYNAKATGGGLINITQGMVNLLDNAASGTLPEHEPQKTLTSRVSQYFQENGLDKTPDLVLTSILAHEVGHIENRDLAANWGQQILAEQMGTCATSSHPGRGLLMELPQAIQNANWDMEFRADARGGQLLEKAGYPRDGIKHMLNVLQIIESTLDKPRTDHDHPPIAERLARF